MLAKPRLMSGEAEHPEPQWGAATGLGAAGRTGDARIWACIWIKAGSADY